MPHSTKGLYHLHTRKRVHVKRQKYPAKQKLKRVVDTIMYAGAFLGPLFTLPQVLKIWVGKDAAGISLFTWSFYFVSAMFWVVYGTVHKEKPIILTYVLLGITYIAIITGAVVYG
jgi:uncharacterized protein with PQ loop repeat